MFLAVFQGFYRKIQVNIGLLPPHIGFLPAYIEDPPAYIRNTSAYKELVSAYKEPIHLQAFRLEAMNSYAVNRHLHIRALGQQQELPSVPTGA